jgi:hypothetical protein
MNLNFCSHDCSGLFSIPDESMKYYRLKFGVQAMLLLNFIDDRIENFKSQIQRAAKQFSANNISFLIGDVEAADRAFQVIFSFSEYLSVINSYH